MNIPISTPRLPDVYTYGFDKNLNRDYSRNVFGNANEDTPEKKSPTVYNYFNSINPAQITQGTLQVTTLLVNGSAVSSSVAGSDTQVQFNDGGSAFGGDAGLTYNKTTDTLTLGNIAGLSTETLDIVGGSGRGVDIESGNASSATGGAGIINIVGGSGGATSGNGGYINIAGGDAVGDPGSALKNGGFISLDAGNSTTLGSGGWVSLTGGDGIGAAGVNSAGHIAITSGNPGTNSVGGGMFLTTTNGLGTGEAGEFEIITAAKGVSGDTTTKNGHLYIFGTGRITGSQADDSSSGIALDPAYTAASAQTLTRHNYLDLQNPSLSSVTLTDACVARFDAAAGTHKAVDSGTTKTTPGTVDAWLKFNINGTIYYIPAYTSKTS